MCAEMFGGEGIDDDSVFEMHLGLVERWAVMGKEKKNRIVKC